MAYSICSSTKEGIWAPPWRVSTTCPHTDVCQFRVRKIEAKYVVRLDPVVGAFWLNLKLIMLTLKRLYIMHYGIISSIASGSKKTPWMTTWKALSPFSQVPAPRYLTISEAMDGCRIITVSSTWGHISPLLSHDFREWRCIVRQSSNLIILGIPWYPILFAPNCDGLQPRWLLKRP